MFQQEDATIKKFKTKLTNRRSNFVSFSAFPMVFLKFLYFLILESIYIYTEIEMS